MNRTRIRLGRPFQGYVAAQVDDAGRVRTFLDGVIEILPGLLTSVQDAIQASDGAASIRLANPGGLDAFFLVSGRTRPTSRAHSRRHAEAGQNPHLQRKPRHDKGEEEKDFHVR